VLWGHGKSVSTGKLGGNWAPSAEDLWGRIILREGKSEVTTQLGSLGNEGRALGAFREFGGSGGAKKTTKKDVLILNGRGK